MFLHKITLAEIQMCKTLSTGSETFDTKQVFHFFIMFCEQCYVLICLCSVHAKVIEIESLFMAVFYVFVFSFFSGTQPCFWTAVTLYQQCLGSLSTLQ